MEVIMNTNLIKISENKELKVKLYTDKKGFEKIQDKFDIEVGFIFLPGYIKVAGGLGRPGNYDIRIQGVIIEDIYLKREKVIEPWEN
jgi:hypothetical protein